MSTTTGPIRYTPGPWRIDSTDPSKRRVVSKTRCVATITVDDVVTYGERNANAHLIALAPELAEALRQCAEHLEVTGGGNDGCLRTACALLAKLDGVA